MTYQQRVDEIAALIATVAGAGIVHNRSRWVLDWGAFIGLFKAPDGHVNGWEITRGPSEPTVGGDWIETYRLRKYYGLKDSDSSDLVFQEHLDSVVRKFRDTHNLSFGAVPIGVRITTIDERLFGNVLVHYAELSLGVTMEFETL